MNCFVNEIVSFIVSLGTITALSVAVLLVHHWWASRRDMIDVWGSPEAWRQEKQRRKAELAAAKKPHDDVRDELERVREEMAALEWLVLRRKAVERVFPGGRVRVRGDDAGSPTIYRTWTEAARALGRSD